MSGTDKLDQMILTQIAACDPEDMQLLLDLTADGYSDEVVETRLIELSRSGHITINKSVGMTTIQSITRKGQARLNELSR